MKRKVVFSALIMGFLVQIIYAGDIEESLFRRIDGLAYERVESPLSGRNVVVRFYNNWKADPGDYKKRAIAYDSSAAMSDNIRAICGDAEDSCVIVIIGEDQTDKEVAEAMSGVVFAERCAGLRSSFDLETLFLRRTQSEENIFFEDALGGLLPSCEVEVYLKDPAGDGARVLLGKERTDGGLLKIPRVIGSLRTFSFVLSVPNYGIALMDRMPIGNHIRTSLVEKNAQAYERAIRGTIVDPDGNPVAGALVECQSVRTLGEGLISPLNGGPFRSIADGNGEFCFYLPNEEKPEERGYLIPPQSSYQVRIEAPKGVSLVPYAEPIENDQDKVIVMEKADHFSTFVFEDANGIISDPSKLQYINVNITRPDKRALRIGYEQLKEGGFFPPGEYKANMYVPGGGKYEFEPVLVDSNSPTEIVFKLPGEIIYSGQVVHGRTGEPMRGAFVIAFNSSTNRNLSIITPEQWDALHELPLEPELSDPAVKPVAETYGIRKIVRTDAQGQFQMNFLPGEVYGFIAFEENYLGIMHRTYALVPDENRIAQIPAMKLYPAAIASVTLQNEERISVNPKWIIDAENNPSWVREFLATDDRSESLFTYDNWLELNKPQTFYIPAGLNVRIKFDSPYHDQWCPVEVLDMLNLAQGQIVDLGNITFERAVQVYVMVLNSKNEPLEGIPVRIVLNENHWYIPHPSDESGLSVFYINPNSSEKTEFGVSYYGQNGEYLKETIPCEIKSRDEGGKLFKFQLSDEMIDKLFNSGEKP